MKIISREEATRIVEQEKKKGLKIGFTSGVFDILHIGHVKYLQDAKKHCDFLIVGVNSNDSVRILKGHKRPIQDDSERAEVVAALKCVDEVFIFSERNNNENVRAIKPDVYIKAGDYSEADLSSAPIVKEYGGSIVIVPMIQEKSTTGIIEKIIQIEKTEMDTLNVEKDSKAVFLDRDGVLIKHRYHLHEPEKVEVEKGTREALLKLKEKGYRLIIVTNQMGLGIGYYPMEQFYEVNRKMFRLFNGVMFEKIYFCPHTEADNCSCRKPKPGMLLKAEYELGVDLKQSWMIGDNTSDIEAGKSAGCKTILIERNGEKGKEKETGRNFDADYCVKNMKEAADIILK